jgi:hypothetical protein
MTGSTGGGSLPPEPIPPEPTTSKLLQAADLTLVGSFRVPRPGGSPEQNPSFGGTALMYWPAHDSLVFVGHDHHQWVTEISIPTPLLGNAVADLPQAEQLQPYTDILQGKLKTIDGDTSNGVKIGGITPRGSDSTLIVNVWSYYDASAAKQTKTHFLVGKWDFAALTPADVTGPFQVGIGYQDVQPGDTTRIGGFVSGYQCVIPPGFWQDSFGVTRLTGQGGGVSILNRTSSGPSCSPYQPADVGVLNPVPAKILMGYPSNSSDHNDPLHHPTLGDWGVDGSGLGLYNGTQYFRGMVFPDNTGSVLFIGWRGTSFCYGSGSKVESEHNVPIEPPQYDAEGKPVVHCYDPTNNSKGTHGYPYEACVFAYDANDLLEVKNGQAESWDVIPYATWKLPIPFQQNFPDAVKSDPYMVQGAAWNPDKRWLFVSGYRQDGDAPVIHVFAVK